MTNNIYPLVGAFATDGIVDDWKVGGKIRQLGRYHEKFSSLAQSKERELLFTSQPSQGTDQRWTGKLLLDCEKKFKRRSACK